jgi:hypothetical protein
MSSTVTHFTKSFPNRADITGSPKQAFNMQDSHEKYLTYVLGGITAGSIATLGSIATGGSFQYLYAPQIHQDLGGQPIGIVGTSSNKMGKFSCIYMNLSNFKLFPFMEPTASMSGLLKHTKVTQLLTNHLKHTTNWNDMADPIRGTLLPNFFIVCFRQEIPHRGITSDDEKTTMAKLGFGYDLWVSMVSDAINNMDDINYIINNFDAVDNLCFSAFYKKHFYGQYEETTSLPILGSPYGTITTVQSNTYPVEVKAIKKIFFSMQQALPQGLATSSALTLQLPADKKKEIVAKDGITKLKLFHICGMIDPESTLFDTLSLATFSKGMDLVVR